MNGLIVLDKPKGASSAKYVYRLRPILDVRRVGHAGSLDPFAEGVLLACVGRATKLVETLMNLPKRYEATLQLGVTSASHDPEQPAEPVPNAREPIPDQVGQVLKRFVGIIEQVPPAFSAIKIGGKPAYQRARRNEDMDLRARPVRIYSITLLEYSWPFLRIDVVCGRGTYIRALARDIGHALGSGAICTALRRLAVGPFEISQAIRLEGAGKQQIRHRLLDIQRVQSIIAEYVPPKLPTRPSRLDAT